MEVETKKHPENLKKKMEKFHNLKYYAYPHAKLNTSKGVVRSKELSLATPEDIETAFKKTRNKRVTKKFSNHQNKLLTPSFLKKNLPQNVHVETNTQSRTFW